MRGLRLPENGKREEQGRHRQMSRKSKKEVGEEYKMRKNGTGPKRH